MGVPKFFRWMSERYPLCSQLINNNNIPVFDNLFLDMNGIIHNCSHGNNDDVHMRISQDKIFINIFAYISHLFYTIKPRKLFFMAIDGVAPRAKINQQRSRRFRTAFEAEEGVRKALLRGEELPEEPAFDSNCITPGTEFMHILMIQLKYFINKKLHEDPAWRNCTIVLSGPDVPGEGEHKIMEYIRLSRSQPDYDPNTRHCLYGLDADLIMLGLLSHDPYFCLLREEVVFGPQQKTKRMQVVEEQAFYLMHLSVLREYLEKEFMSVQPYLTFPFDLERIIDDFILMALFVGNDFLPHLPDIHINEGALALMFEMYKKALPQMGGYMNNQGQIEFERLEKLLLLLAEWEEDKFFELHPSGKHALSKKTSKKVLSSNQARALETLTAFLADDIMSTVSISHGDDDQTELDFIKKLSKELGLVATVENSKPRKIQISRYPCDSDDSDQSAEDESHLAQMRVIKKYSSFAVMDDSVKNNNDRVNDEFRAVKSEYYAEKMHIREPSELEKFVGFYAQGLQWVMDYYYNGVQSWNWFFPYHYAPKISDLVPGIRGFYEKMPPFQLGDPFNPFEQLLAVLPSRSKMLLPEPLRDLMYDKSSPILDFYPLDFETDLNGKKNDWEAVVKIPFIDERRLLDAMRPRLSLIASHDRMRMKFGESITARYDPAFSFHLQSTIPGILPDIINCKTRVSAFHLPTVDGITSLRKTIHPAARIGVKSLPGFPSLKTIAHSSDIVKAGIKVFQADSRNESVVITIHNKYAGLSVDELAGKLLGSKVYINWPYLQDAVLVKISDQYFDYILDPGYSTVVYALPRPVRIVKQPKSDIEKWHRVAERLESEYHHYKGISTGPVEVMIHVAPLKGMKRLDNGAIVKEYMTMSDLKDYPLQTLVETVEIEDDRFVERPPPPIEQEFPIGCFGFFLGENESGLYGCHIEVEGHFRKRLNLRVMQTYHVSAYSAEMLKRYRDESVYYNLPSVAKKLGVSPMSLSRITSNVYVVSDSGTKMDIGLHLKFESRQQKVIGYTRRSDRGWELSKQAVDLIREYHESFPTILPYLNKPGGDDVNSVDIFGADSDSELKRLQSWLSAKNIKTFIQVALDVEMFPGNIVAELERFVDSIMKPEAEPETRTLSDIPAQFVLLPAQASYRLTVRQKFALGDRVVFIPDSGASGVLISGAAGTVIGIEKTQPRKMHPRPQQHQSGKQFRGKSSEVVSDYWVHLLLDERTVGASTLDGICSPGRGITVRSTCLLNLTNPQPPVYRRLTDEPMQSINQSESPSSTGAKGQNVKILQNNSFKTRQNVWTKRDNQRQMLNTLKATSIQKQDTSLLRSDPPSISKNELAFQLKSILNIDDGTTISASPLIPAEESPPKTSSAAVKVPSWLLGTLPTSVIAARSLSSKQQQ